MCLEYIYVVVWCVEMGGGGDYTLSVCHAGLTIGTHYTPCIYTYTGTKSRCVYVILPPKLTIATDTHTYLSHTYIYYTDTYIYYTDHTHATIYT